jgi:hypothetical protein
MWYIEDQKSQTRGMGVARIRARAAMKAIKNGTLFTLAWNFAKRLFQKDLRSEYREVVQSADLSRPFVYFALNFQPERTTSPQGEMYHDQILAAETLAAALPEGWELYIKEHPSQWLLRSKTRYTSARYPGYYHRLARIPCARVVPIETPGRTLTNAAQAVATITGTTGLEAVMWGKKPLIFGAAWYRDCPGVLRVQSVEDCKRAYEDIQKEKNVPREDVLAFLKALEDVALRTNIGDKMQRMTHEETMHTFARSALEFLGESH